MRIEAVTMNDAMAATIADMINRSFAEAEDWFVEGDRIQPDGVKRLAADPGGQFFVAYADDDAPVGCVYTEIRDDDVGYFGLLAVDERRRGGGIGHQLVNRAEQHLKERGCRRVEITVVDLRAELFPYYGRRGYRLDGRTLPFPRVSRQPCILRYMSKDL